MGLQVPVSLKNGHDSIHASLKRAMGEPGRTGEAARAVARIMDGHTLREEKFALRPLGLLKALARGETPAELAEVVRLTEGFQRGRRSRSPKHDPFAGSRCKTALSPQLDDRAFAAVAHSHRILHAI